MKIVVLFRRCPRFDNGPGWDEDFTGRVLSRLAKIDPPVFDYTEGALDSIVSEQDPQSILVRGGGGGWQRRAKLILRSIRMVAC